MRDKMVEVAVKAMDSKLGKNIKVLDIEEITQMTDSFVICAGNSSTQVKAIADEVEFKMEEAFPGIIFHREGYGNGEWILLDFKDIVVHVFNEETREFYNLEHLWADGKERDISSLIVE